MRRACHATGTRRAGGHEPRPVSGPLTERSDLMTQKICFDCFHKLFPDKPIRKVTLGRQCVVCKAQTDRTEQMIPVEAEDIPLVKQIAQVPRRVLHRTERHADRRVAVRVAARGAGQVGRDAGQAGPRDPRYVRAMSADLDKAKAVLAVVGCVRRSPSGFSRQRHLSIPLSPLPANFRSASL